MGMKFPLPSKILNDNHDNDNHDMHVWTEYVFGTSVSCYEGHFCMFYAASVRFLKEYSYLCGQKILSRNIAKNLR